MSLNPLMKVITISKGIERVEIEDQYYSDEEGHHDEDKQLGHFNGSSHLASTIKRSKNGRTDP